MYKLNKNGFALAETLIASVFVMTIFTIIFLNFFPMMGEYERRQNYDDIDSIYKTYLIKRMLESNGSKAKQEFQKLTTSNPYILFDVNSGGVCNKVMNGETINYCNNLLTETKTVKLILTNYRTEKIKSMVKEGTADFGGKLNDYISTLPYYKRSGNNLKQYNYRIIVMYEKVINAEDDASTKKINSFSTIGVSFDD